MASIRKASTWPPARSSWSSSLKPVYDAPAELKFGEAIKKAKSRVHWGLHDDETGELCQWHVPGTHELESWGDALAHDGTASLIQPLVEPLYGGKSAIEFLGVFQDKLEVSGYDLVPGLDRAAGGRAISKIVARRSTRVATRRHRPPAPPRTLRIGRRARSVARVVPTGKPPPRCRSCSGSGAYDGSLASNGWLQEMPKPITAGLGQRPDRLPETAQDLGLTMKGKPRSPATKLEVGVWCSPAMPTVARRSI